MRILTVGHSDRAMALFLRILDAHGIRRIADVRSLPRSRHNPQFNADVLGPELAHAGIRYDPLPRLGGLRRPRPGLRAASGLAPGLAAYAEHMETEEFARGVEELLRIAAGSPAAFMCAEASPRRCHRSLLSDALLARGVEVRHILDESRSELHRLTPGARLEGGRVIYAGVQPSLFDG